MLTPVVIGTHPDRAVWLKDCVTSIRATTKHRRVLIHRTGGYEPAAILTGCAAFKRFLYLHDSVIIKTREFWDTIDSTEPAWLAGFPPMYLAVYHGPTVAPLLPTHEVTKHEAIRLEAHLPTLLPLPTLWPNVTDATALRHEYRHGRDNKVLGNSHFEKFKGTWS